MRMWMVNPQIMCNQHLLGEHVELHMFVGSMERHISMKGYIENNLMEPASIHGRHERLAEEMQARGMKHQSSLGATKCALASQYLPPSQFAHRMDYGAAQAELLRRCPACRARAAAGSWAGLTGQG